MKLLQFNAEKLLYYTLMLATAGAFVLSTETVAQQTSPATDPQCIETDEIQSYKIETDDMIRFTMKDGERLIMRLKSYCPQLRFHGYFSYTPMNGRLCAGADEIKTRSGLPCMIGSLAPDGKQKDTVPANK